MGSGSHRRLRLFALVAALPAGALAWLVAPALSFRPYVPDPVDFEMKAAGRSATVESGRRFNVVGLRWRGADAGTVRLQVRDASGAWSRWAKLVAGKDRPDAGDREGTRGWTASEPVWAGQADAVRYRIVAPGPVGDVRLHFVNSTGSATALDRFRTGVRRAAAGALASIASIFDSAAGAGPIQPSIVTRAEWGASKCPPRVTPAYGTVKLAFVHHTVSVNTYAPEESAAIVLGICRYHRNSNGWNDIGYQFLVDRYGQIFEGRAGGMDQAVVGAQAQGYNSVSTGIANIGTFSNDGQTPEGLAALARLLSWKLAIHGVSPEGTVVVRSAGGSSNRYPAGRSVRLEHVAGHRDGDATACPGDALYAQLPQIRAMVTGDTRTPAALTLTGAERSIQYGRSVLLDGSLTTEAGEPLAGELVQIRALAGARVRTLSTLATSATGKFEMTVPLSYNHTLVAGFAGNSSIRPAQSAPVGVSVRPRLGIAVKQLLAGALRSGQQVVVRGSVRPRKRKLFLLVDRGASGGTYRRVAKLSIRARRGRGSVRYRFRRPGRYRLRVGVKSDLRNLGARSKPVVVAVR